MIKRIAIIASGLVGMTNASLALAKNLRLQNYDIIYLSPVDLSERCNKEQIDFHKISGQSIFEFWKNPISFNKKRNNKLFFNEYYDSIQFDNFVAQIRRQKIDFAIVDMEMHEHILAMYSAKIPFTLCSQWFSIWEGNNFPPPSSLIIPADDTHAIVKAEWNNEKNKRQRASIKNTIKTFGINRKSALRYKANVLKFDKKNWIENLWPTPFVYANMPVISMTAEEMDFKGSERRSLYYVGPQVDICRYEIEPSEFSSFLSKLESRLKDRKLIYFSSSTLNKKRQSEYFQQLLKIVQEREDLVLIYRKKGASESYSDRIIELDWIPQINILPYVDICIHHGGIHTIHECIVCNTPMVIYPGNMHDQNGCVARFQKLKTACIKTIDLLDIEHLEFTINELISIPEEAKNYDEFSSILKKYENLEWNTLFKKLRTESEAIS